MTDTKEIREAREKVTEAEENIQIAGLEKDIAGLNDIMDSLDRKIEDSNKYYDALIEQANNYWDSLIKGLEDYKSRWQELTDIEEQAKMDVALRNLNITTDDILNMSGSAFESFKGTYLGLLNEMYAGNDEMLNMLQRFGGISTDTLNPLSGTIDTVAGSLDTFTVSTGDTVAAVHSVSDALNEVPDVDISGSIEQFNTLGNSVDSTTASISGGNAKADRSGGSVGKNVPKTQSSSGNGSDSLISSIVNVGETTAETLGEPGGDGAIGKFGELGDTIADAEGHVTGIADGLNDLDGMTAECTIKVNVETNGSIPEYASDTPLAEIGSMYMKSGEFVPKYRGNAYAEGTGKYKGLPKAEKNALVSEYGQTEMTVLPNGDTIITDEPTLMDLPKDTVIFNEEQTKQIMGNKVDASGKAHAGGTGINTIDHEIVLKDGTRLHPIQPGDRGYDLMKAGEAFIAKFRASGEEFISNAFFDGQKQLEKMTKEIINNTAINNITNNNRNIQQPINQTFNITMPNVTNATSAEELMRDLQSLNRKKFQVDWNK